MIWRLMRDADDCREVFTRVYGYCVAGILFMHLFINIGMTIGIMPVIGIPLPLFSYGGFHNLDIHIPRALSPGKEILLEFVYLRDI